MKFKQKFIVLKICFEKRKMVNIGNYSFKIFKLITLVIVLLNLVCYGSSADESKRDHRARFGTQWNRIGKRYVFRNLQEQTSHDSLESEESQELKPKSSLIAKAILTDELADIYDILKKQS